jgi:hypothetical protein
MTQLTCSNEMKDTPLRDGFIVLLKLCAVLIGVGWLCLTYLLVVPRISASEFRSIPLGTSREDVKAWLRARDVPFEEYVNPSEERIVGPKGAHAVGGRLEKIYRFQVFNTAIEFDFYFDEEDRLIQVEVTEEAECL